MERTCAQAAELGLPAVAFTDHMDFTVWKIAPNHLEGFEHPKAYTTPDWALHPPEMDVNGYLGCVQRCRDKFADLRIITGMELGEPHRNGEAAARLLGSGQFERVNGSLHSLQIGEEFFEPPSLYRLWPPAKVVREYLAEIIQMVRGSDLFGVLAISVMRSITGLRRLGRLIRVSSRTSSVKPCVRLRRGRALEMNVGGKLRPWIVQWWSEEHGEAITFGSDAHEPTGVGRNFPEAVEMVESLAEVFAEFQLKHSQKLLTNEEASERIQAHTEFALTDETLRAPRIVLIAGDFPQTVTASAVWLSEMGLDITLTRINAYRASAGTVVTVSQHYPR